jgi:hypothetical protein
MTSEATTPRDALAAQASARHPNKPKRYLSRTALAKRWGKSKRTVARWGRDPRMGLPEEVWLNGMPHREEGEVEAWEAERRGKRVIGSRI